MSISTERHGLMLSQMLNQQSLVVMAMGNLICECVMKMRTLRSTRCIHIHVLTLVCTFFSVLLGEGSTLFASTSSLQREEQTERQTIITDPVL